MQYLVLGFVLEVQPLLLETAANVFYFLDCKNNTCCEKLIRLKRIVGS